MKSQLAGDGSGAVADALAPVEVRALSYAGTMRIATWFFAVVAGVTLFYFGLVMGTFVPWLALPLTVSGIIAALYSAWVLRKVWRDVKADAPVITVNAQGYRDSRLGEMIPWREVKTLTRDQPGTQILLRIEAVRAERFLKPRYKFPFGSKPAKPVPPGVVVVSNLSGLDRSGDDVVSAAERFFLAARATAAA